MEEVFRTNDLVKLSYIKHVLSEDDKCMRKATHIEKICVIRSPHIDKMIRPRVYGTSKRKKRT